jgi:hypothetical protein
MEVYILDDQFRRTEVVDRFESLIWTERYTAYGDFELVTHSTPPNRSLFPKGTCLALNESSRVMTVETIENKLDPEGKATLSLSGRSIESILEDRVATDSWGNLTVNPNWKITGTPGNIARTIFNTVCRDGLLSVADKIPFLEGSTIGNLFYTRPEPGEVITVELEHQSVYTAIKDLCEAYGLGFYLVRVGDTSKLRFKIFTGNDRTLYQTAFSPVVFSHELGNMENISELQSTEQFKNVAYVFAKNGVATVYAPGWDASTATGFNRRVVQVKHDGDETGAALTTILNQKGFDALAQARGLFAFDGEIPQRGSYRYGRDYFLGDLVELRNSDNVSSRMRVTEQIFTSDAEGDKSYPTLSVELTATPGSWAAENEPATWVEQSDTWSTAST